MRQNIQNNSLSDKMYALDAIKLSIVSNNTIHYQEKTQGRVKLKQQACQLKVTRFDKHTQCSKGFQSCIVNNAQLAVGVSSL